MFILLKRYYINIKLKYIVLLLCLPLISCSGQTVNRDVNMVAAQDVQSLLDDLSSGKIKDIGQCKDIVSSDPKNGSSVDSESDITVSFRGDMDPASFTYNSVIIYEGKHSSVITSLFNLNYDKNKKQLSLSFKMANGGGVGTGNSVAVFLTKDIKRKDGTYLDDNYCFVYNT